MCGRRADLLRVIHVGVRWTFVEVIHHLFGIFIDESALQLAVQSYYRDKYTEPKRVYSYIRELEKKANQLTSKPNEFMFRERFIDELPGRLVVDKMINRYNITAESSTIDQMTTTIRKIEKSSAYREHVKERRTHRSDEPRSPNPHSHKKRNR
jgi:hypothetical protein